MKLDALNWPRHRPAVVLDTDTYNEIDDQFALVYCLLASDRFDLKAVNAAPFHNKRSSGPEDGMAKSMEEIQRVLQSMNRQEVPVLTGSTRWLQDSGEPEDSAAAANLIRLARECEERLYVITIGAPTNVANALLLAPDIRDKVVVLWLGGHPGNWYHTGEFNMMQDPASSRVMLEEGTNLVRFPCANVAAHLTISLPEMEQYVKGRGAIGNYLCEIFAAFEHTDLTQPYTSKVIWDIAPVAWLIEESLVSTCVIPCPLLTTELTWSHDPRRHLTREAYQLNRDGIFRDLFERLPVS